MVPARGSSREERRELSIVIPHYGDPAPTEKLMSQLNHQHGGSREIIVVDDFSPLPFHETAGCVVVHRRSNGGFGSAVNSGAEVASGDYLLVLNSDLDLTEDFISSFLSATQQLQPGVFSPRIVENGQHNWAARRFPRTRHVVWEWLTPLARIRETTFWHWMVGHDTRAARSDQPVETDWVMGACMLIPRWAFEAAGGFDERYFMNSEEVDLQRRLREYGVPSVYLPNVQVKHASGGTQGEHRRGWVVDSRFIYFHKWGGARRLWLGLRLATEVNFLWNLTRQARGIDVDALRTRTHELSLIRHSWKSRHGKDATR